MDEILIQAKALGDQTRYRIFRYVDDASRPVYVDELTELLAVNHNAVRQHLSILKGAQLVVEQLEARSKPGRPRLQYTIHPSVRGRWGTDGPYKTIALLMAEMLRSSRSAVDVGKEAGARRLDKPKGRRQSVVEVLEESLAHDGFDPRNSASADGWEFVLQKCPYSEVATIDPSTVCQLHLGMLEGQAKAFDDQVDIRLSVRDPRRAGCKVKVRMSGKA